MIAESRLAWQKFDEEMKKMDLRSHSRLGQDNNIEVEHTSNNNKHDLLLFFNIRYYQHPSRESD